MVFRRVTTLLIAVLVLASMMAPAAAIAAPRSSFDYLFNMERVSNDNQMFLNLTVGRFGTERVDLEPLLPRLRNLDDDLPVVLFLAQKSYTPLPEIVALRSRGFSWAVIFDKVEVPVSALFRGIRENPGPPYGKAWGHWSKNPKSLRLSDAEVAGLVHIQIGARFARMSPLELARARGQGRKVATLVAANKGRPWQAGKPEHAAGKGHAKDKSKHAER